ncbi:MAG: hypothetical protein HY553_06585 [Elusimicrobia bacterium]|nr:hypothetical protein [Elusimicrobiota bacterium]
MSLLARAALLALSSVAAAQDVPIRVEANPGAGTGVAGAAGGATPGIPGGAALGPELRLRSTIPNADPIGPIMATGRSRSSASPLAGNPNAGAVAGNVAGAGTTVGGGQGARAWALAGSLPGRGPRGAEAPAGAYSSDDPVRGGGPGAPVSELQAGVVQAIEGAKKAEGHGERGALGQTLNAVFEGDALRRRAHGSEPPDAARELAGLPPSEQVKKLSALAESAGPTDAPSLYRHAAEVAAKGLPASEAPPAIRDLNASASRRAPEALRRVATEGVTQAFAGDLKGRSLAKVADAIDFWNAQAYLGGHPSLSNAADLKASIARLQDSAARPRPAKTKAPTLRFVPDSQEPAAGPRVRAVLKGGEEAPAAVGRVPEVFAETLALSETVRASLDLPVSDALMSEFRLNPPAGPGARAAFARARARGENRAESLWAAARFWLSSVAGGVWRRLVRWVRGALAVVGLVDGPGRLAPAASIAAPDDALRRAAQSAGAFAFGFGGGRLLDGRRVGPAWARGEAGAVHVRLGRVDADTRAFEARFAAFEELQRLRRRALGALAAPQGASAAAAAARSAVGAFETLAGDRAAKRLADSARSFLSDGRGQDADALALDKPSLNRLLETLSQAASERLASVAGQASPNALLSVESGGGVAVLDLAPESAAGRLAPALRALAATLAAGTPLEGSFIVRGRLLWSRPASGSEVLADLGAPESGGLVRVRLQSQGDDVVEEARLYLVARALYGLGFSVQVGEGMLSAVADRDHNAASPDELEDRLPVVFAALHAAAGLRAHYGALVEGAAGREDVGRRIEEWAGAILAEGRLPQSPTGWARYRGLEAGREALRSGVDRALKDAGLPELPATDPLGQRTLDLRLNRPIEAGLARGELKADPSGRVVQNAAYDPLPRFLADAVSSPKAAAELADVLASNGGGAFRFESLGSAGRLRFERAQRRLAPGVWLNLYAFTDPASGRPLLAWAERSSPDGASRLSAGALLSELSEPPLAVSGPSLDERVSRLKAPAADPSGVEAESLADAPRAFAVRLSYDKSKTEQGGVAFATPYVSPSEWKSVSGSRGLLVTSGWGSTFAAQAGRAGLPVLVLPGSRWTDAGLQVESLRFTRPRPGPGGLRFARVESRAAAVLREGAVLRVDGRLGRLTVVPKDREGVVLRAAEAVTAFERSGDAAAFTGWLRSQLESGGLAELERVALAETVVDGVSESSSYPSIRRALLESLGPGAPATIAAIESR